MERSTSAWLLRVKKRIDKYSRRPTKVGLRVQKRINKHLSTKRAKVESVPALRAELLLDNPRNDEGKPMASAKQKAAARRNIKKAQAARRRKMRTARKPRRARRARRRARANPVAKTAAGRRRQRAASRRNIKKAQRARRRTRRVRSRVRAIRKAAGPGGVRIVRVRPASTPIVIEEKVKSRKRRRRRSKAMQANPAKRRRRTRRRRSTMLQNEGMTFRKSSSYLDNPGPGFGLMRENQVFSMSAIRAWGTAAAGVGIGLVFADFLDRFVATRKPTGGNHPWFGANAAAAQARRPDAWRLGSQAAGGLASLGAAYFVRGRGILPWLLGGAAIGFGANLTKMLIDWWLMPMVLKVDPAKPTSLANRLYPLEQKNVQDAVDALFESYQTTTNLALNQQADPVVTAVTPPSNSPIYTLGARGRASHPQQVETVAGKARTQAEVSNGQVGQPVLVPTGRLGMCDSCGGHNGCWSSCPDLTLCGECPQPTARMCTYDVRPGDDLNMLASQLGIDVSQVNALNPPGTPSAYWLAGRTVTLPYAFCRGLQASQSRLHGTPQQSEGNGASVPPPIKMSALPFDLVNPPEE